MIFQCPLLIIFALLLVAMIISIIVMVLGDNIDAVLYIALYGYVSAEVVELLNQRTCQQAGEGGESVQDSEVD